MDDSRTGRRPTGALPEHNESLLGGAAESLGATLSSIIENLQNIVRGEVQLAKTELKEEASTMGKGAGMIGAGVFFGLVGFIFLMLALTYLLNKALEMWISAGIVGLGLVVIAAILAMVGKNRLSEANLVPQKTIQSVKEDQEWASRQMKSVRK